MKRAVWRLDELQPEWVRLGEGWGHGVSWRCGRHGTHRLRVMFQNPADGCRVVWVGGAYARSGTSFSTLTLLGQVDLGECFRGWVEDGDLLEEAAAH